MAHYKTLILVLLTTCGLATLACRDPDDTPGLADGAISLRVDVGAHAVDTLHYELSRPGDPALSGDFDISGGGTVANAHIGAVPAGDNYKITLTADTSDGAQHCEGASEAFAVAAELTTAVRVVVSCRDVPSTDTTETTSSDETTTAVGTEGSVSLEIPFNSCPEVTSITATPGFAGAGETIVLASSASDADGDVLSFSWSENGVTFANGSDASFTCTAMGTHILVLSVLDANCTASTASVSVECF